MSMVYLQLDTLAKIDDGVVAALFRKAAEQVIRDCEDRPALNKGRTVTLTMTMKPVADEGGRCDGLRAWFDVKHNVPMRQTNGVDLSVKAGGKAAFHIEDEEVTEEADEDAA